MKKYEDFDRLEQMFFDEILEVVRKKMMEASTFFKRYEENPKYVQHYPPVYWADFIIEQVT